MQFSSGQFTKLLAQRRQTWADHEGYRTFHQELCGPVPAEVFLEPVGIGRFAQVTGLPPSTIRHYVNQGLLTPWRVDTRFRFEPANVWELRSLRQRQDLGWSLSQIAARKRQLPPQVLVKDIFGPLTFAGRDLPYAVVIFERKLEKGGFFDNLTVGDEDEELLQELQLTQTGLDEQLQRLTRARELVERLQSAVR